MELELIVKSIIGLLLILAILIFFLFFEPNKADKKKLSFVKPKEDSSVEKYDFKSLVKIVKDKTTDSATLTQTLELIIKHYGTINKKLGTRPHPDFEIYADLIFTICRHKNTNKHIPIYRM